MAQNLKTEITESFSEIVEIKSKDQQINSSCGVTKSQIYQSVNLSIQELENLTKLTDQQQTDQQI
jgi:hypothetical protein